MSSLVRVALISPLWPHAKRSSSCRGQPWIAGGGGASSSITESIIPTTLRGRNGRNSWPGSRRLGGREQGPWLDEQRTGARRRRLPGRLGRDRPLRRRSAALCRTDDQGARGAGRRGRARGGRRD